MEPKRIDEEIKIKAEVLDPERCKFTVDRPVFRAGGSLQLASRDEAKGFPLAEKLFEIENVTAVLVSGDTVTIAKSGPDDWAVIGKKAGKAIREHLQSEAATISSAISELSRDITLEERIMAKVQHVLDTQINPGVEGHGGHVTLLDVKGNVIYIKMGGGCQGCGMAPVTLKQGIEKSIRQYVPEVTEILDTTDHASGRNPFYAPSAK